jgi:2,3-bisphosphoglycerate-independent phosphoglycerate mutase
MIPEHVLSSLATETDSKLVLVVIDGLGGLPIRGKTELERAKTPHLDRLASKSMCGLVEPLGCGITPGSGPSHLALFGYDPFSYEIGRGVMEALGMGIHLTRSDLTARGNFATIDREGVIRDRRAGRIPSEKTRELCQYLQEKIPHIGEVKISIHPGKEHRFVVLFQGEALKDDLSDADPQKDGFKAKMAEPLSREA